MRTRVPLALLALGIALAPAAARADATVTVAVGQDAHPISPLIYGVNFASAAQAAAGHLPLTRWGGNSTSRYNYQLDVSNSGADYFFENVAGCWGAETNWCASPPKDPKADSGANAFLDGAGKQGMVALLTVPTIGWVAKVARYAHPFDCGCPKSLIAQQDGFDPYDTNCGDCKRGGAWLAPPPATTTSTSVDATWAGGWAAYLVGRSGGGAGKRIYALDNEPNLWSSTHHDVHPAPLSYDEEWQRMRDHAAALLAADPGAEVAGPSEWGWPNYLCSDADDISKGCTAKSPDRAKHGGAELTAWLLDQFAADEKQRGKRLLHYLDLHYYPMGGNPPDNVRSLWDPTYVDPSWINDSIRLIPRMRDWVAQHYPGTKLMISEYDWGHHDESLGIVTYTEVLGTFAREGLDAATAWSPPSETEAAFAAYRLYRNYDGAGGAFGGTYARATVSGGGVASYAAEDPGRVTVILVNEQQQKASATVVISGAVPSGAGALWVATSAVPQKQPDVALTAGGFVVALPPVSAAILVVPTAVPDLGVPVDLAGLAGSDAAPSGDLAGKSAVDGPQGGAAPADGCACRVGERAGGADPATALLSALVLALLRNRPRPRR